MAYNLKLKSTKVFAIGTVLLNILYFIPRTMEWLSWKSGITMAYVGIELIFNYVIHIFLFFACISLIGLVDKTYNLYCFFILIGLSFISLVFAFRIIDWIAFIVSILYIGLFYRIFQLIKKNNGVIVATNTNVIGFFLSLAWLVMDQYFF